VSPYYAILSKTLPTLKQKARRKQAVAIGRFLINLTRKNATLVRQVVSGYSSAANQRMRIVLTRQEHAHFGLAVIEFVKLLNIQGLDIRVVGFRVGDQRSNAAIGCRHLVYQQTHRFIGSVRPTRTVQPALSIAA
jgi:type IV pilus biogenesis protein CpaD/CtpE